MYAVNGVFYDLIIIVWMAFSDIFVLTLNLYFDSDEQSLFLPDEASKSYYLLYAFFAAIKWRFQWAGTDSPEKKTT